MPFMSFGTLIGFFIFLGIVYLIGRAFGGTGNFGELAFDMSLFWAPLMVVRALISIIAIGPLAFLVWQLGEETMRLALAHRRSEGQAIVEAYKRMSLRAIAEP